MTRGMWTKWIIGAAILLLIVAAGCFLWYQHTTAQYKAEADKDDKLLQQWEADKAKPPAETESTQAPAESTTPTAERPPNDTTQDNETANTEVSIPKMSKFGLGEYPEIPKDGDYPANYFETSRHIYSELLRRVNVKMHNEGILDKYSSIGINHETGLVIPIEHGSILVEYATDEGGEQRIIRTKGHPDILPPNTIYTHSSQIPSHIKIVTAKEIAIDPYEYLGLQKP